MHTFYRAGPAALLCAVATLSQAQAIEPAQAPAPEAVPQAERPRPAEPKFEGAFGLVLAYKPAFSGSSDRGIKPELAGFVRYGRFTLTGAGGFATRRQDEVERGLDAELLRRDRVRVNLALRFDGGRRESESSQLAGMGNIEPTVRTRLLVRFEPAPRWTLSLGAGIDSLGRGGGYTLDAGVSRSFVVGERQRLSLGATLSGAGDRYLQTWYGVTQQQSAASGYPAYEPREGLRDVSVGATWRIEIEPGWAAFASAGAGRLLGPAADSPLTRSPSHTSLAVGIARRF